MQEIATSFEIAFNLIVGLNAELVEIVALSLRVSLTAVAIALCIGMPLGAALAIGRFRGRFALTVVVNSFMAMPPVVVGLVVYLLLSRAGPLGVLGLLYTPAAMIIAQVLLITPIVVSLSRQTIVELDREYADYFLHWQSIA